MTGSHAIGLRGAWRLGGALLLVAAASTVTTAVLVDNPTGTAAYVVAIGAAAIGIACLLAPWQSMDERLLVAIPVLAIIEIAVAAALVDYVLTCLYFTVALYVALVFPRPRDFAAIVALVILALLLPFAYADQSAEQTARWLLVVGPAVVFIATVAGLLTTRLHTSRETYRRLSTVDGLTGVGNYRALMARLEHETQRHSRRHREFALLTLDLDNFKLVNDTHGHLLGDAVLTTVGSLIDLQVRAEDGIFRQGGDEFSVVAPETDREGAVLLAERIGQALGGLTSGSVPITASIGKAIYPHHGAEPGELLEAADRDLRLRKRKPAGSGAGIDPE